MQLNNNISLSGNWLIETVDENGKIELPFGHAFQKNQILDGGIDAIFQPGQSNSSAFIPAVNLIYSAALGSDTSPTNAAQTGLISPILSTTNIISCAQSDDFVNGSRTFTKIFEFPIAVGLMYFNECGIIYQKTDGTTGYFSRFVFPEPIKVIRNQRVRLTYQLTITVGLAASPISYSFPETEGFDLSGQLGWIGAWDELMGGLTGCVGVSQTVAVPYPLLPFGDLLPQNQSAANSTAAALFISSPGPSFDPKNTSIPSYSVPAGFSTINNFGAVGGRAYVTPYVAGSKTQSCIYRFSPSNPTGSTVIDGILFRPRAASYTNGKPNCGFYYKFNNPQTKNQDYILTVELVTSIA